VSSRIVGSVAHSIGSVIVVYDDWGEVSLRSGDLDVKVARIGRVARVEQVNRLDGELCGEELLSLLKARTTCDAVGLVDGNREWTIGDRTSIESDGDGVSSKETRQ